MIPRCVLLVVYEFPVASAANRGVFPGLIAQREETIRKWHRPSQVVFTDHRNKHDVRDLLDTIWTHSQREMSLTGSRMMVVGMPNVGKSSLLNALRKEGLGKAKAARTGAQPGVTRKIATSVKIILGNEKSEGVYLLDTPGVFVPYVPDAEAMLRLALCGSVKDTIVHPTTLADYLLFHMNKVDAGLYEQYCPPTNDIRELLSAVATKTGRLQKGGTPDLEASALWIIQRWRNGHLGRFVLDEVSEDALADYSDASANAAPSMTQARKAFKDMQRQKSKSSTVSAG